RRRDGGEAIGNGFGWSHDNVPPNGRVNVGAEDRTGSPVRIEKSDVTAPGLNATSDFGKVPKRI
ncbi:MAG TPA: hypothetical protein VFT97_02970, partial [Candidatus Eisenbacteria bacterium]|nr:hypothetical protein [Candidatus Eisenbacteria bacterium]